MSDIQIKHIYAAYTTENEFDKLGECLGFSFDKDVATLLVKDKGWYGGNGKVLAKNALLVDHTIYLLERTEPLQIEEIKDVSIIVNAARAKLSDLELKALGLT